MLISTVIAVIQLYTHTHTHIQIHILFIFFSIVVYHGILNTVPCVIQ